MAASVRSMAADPASGAAPLREQIPIQIEGRAIDRPASRLKIAGERLDFWLHRVALRRALKHLDAPLSRDQGCRLPGNEHVAKAGELVVRAKGAGVVALETADTTEGGRRCGLDRRRRGTCQL